MKNIVKVKTFSGSMSFTINADTIQEAQQKVVKVLQQNGWAEVKNREPNVSEFRVSKYVEGFIKL